VPAESWTALIAAILAAPIASAATWFTTRRRYAADTGHVSAQSDSVAVATMRSVLEEVRQELHATRLDLQEARDELDALSALASQQAATITALQSEVHRLERAFEKGGK
jgi:Skp family chaperone for outer membrane proteins